MTPAWQDNHVVDPRRLWEIYDGETYWIMAPTIADAFARWLSHCADVGEMDEVKIRDVTERAHKLSIRGDEDVGPPRSALQWMAATPEAIAVIGASVW